MVKCKELRESRLYVNHGPDNAGTGLIHEVSAATKKQGATTVRPTQCDVT